MALAPPPQDAESRGRWFQLLWDYVRGLDNGLTTTVPLAKITSGGTDGSLTFTNGVLTSKVDPT